MRFTIARGMGWVAILAMNAALLRAFLLDEMFDGGIFIFVALQVGLWCLLHSRGRRRRFWLGFEISGIAAVVFLFACELFPDSPLNHSVISYTEVVAILAYRHLPTQMEDHLDRYWHLFLATVYFAPELVAALAGGLVALVAPWNWARSRPIHQEASTVIIG